MSDWVPPNILDQVKQPGWITTYDPSTMSLAPEISQRLGGINLNTQGLDAFRTQALRSGPSPWAMLQNKSSYAQEADQRERAKREARSGAAGGRSMLAMRGGLTSGARERLARGGALASTAASQDASRQGGLNRLQIGIGDETNRIAQLSQLPGMELGKYNADLAKENVYDASRNADITRSMQENQAKNTFQQNTYQQQLQAKAAETQAKATTEAGK